MNRTARLVPAGLTALLLAGVAALRPDADPIPAEQVEAYFAAVRGAVEDVPLRWGAWSGSDAPIPQAAQKLLRPNVTLSRAYASAEHRVGCHVLLVHCRDVRDMVGHYPPNCYPSQGWTAGDASDLAVDLGLPEFATYAFERRHFSEQQEIVIHGFFALPSGEIVSSMERVRQAEADNLARPLGAAQVQLLFDVDVPPEQRERAARDMLEMLRPALEAILRPELPR